MKTKKEKSIKFCSVCTKAVRKKDKGAWAIRFPYWICRECGIQSHKNFTLMSKGKFKEGLKGVWGQAMGDRIDRKKTMRKTKSVLQKAGVRKKAYDDLRKQGFSDKEITKGWEEAGFIKKP